MSKESSRGPALPGRLVPILSAVRARAAQRRLVRPLGQLVGNARPDPERRRAVLAALGGDGLAVIAECKRRSPSAGELAPGDDIASRSACYAAAGAAMISVLTEEDHFGGSPADLASALLAGRPVLRKDFVLDEGMVYESAAWGAHAVLLLAVVHDGETLATLCALARELGMASLVEVHDESELERALFAGPDLLGVNARNLDTFDVDLRRVEELLPRLPGEVLRVAESGLRSIEDVGRVAAAGADAVLVGEALMLAPDPGAVIRSFRELQRVRP